MASKGNKSFANAASNLANLLPTGTLLVFEAILPSFSNDGNCFPANRYLTLATIVCCAVTCFLSSFTDSFVSQKDEKLYYGIATWNGLYIFNDCNGGDDSGEQELNEEQKAQFKISLIDFVHAFGSLTVFLVFALSSSDVQECFFPKQGDNEKQMIMNLPLGAGILSSFLFVIFPTKRRGIGYGDMTPARNNSPVSSNDKA